MDPKLQEKTEPTEAELADARIIWDYQCLYEKPEQADFIIASGHDIRLIELAVDLYKQGYAPLLIASGGHLYGETRGFASEYGDMTEAEVYKRKAIEMGVPEDAIILQDRSQNIGDVFTQLKIIFEQRDINPRKGIFVYEPDKQRRGKASLEKQWPEISTIVTSIPATLDEYANDQIPILPLIKQIVGNMKRIIEYPALGFQSEQYIPDYVMEAYEKLVGAGYLK